jgi:hypothetical protein
METFGWAKNKSDNTSVHVFTFNKFIFQKQNTKQSFCLRIAVIIHRLIPVPVRHVCKAVTDIKYKLLNLLKPGGYFFLVVKGPAADATDALQP